MHGGQLTVPWIHESRLAVPYSVPLHVHTEQSPAASACRDASETRPSPNEDTRHEDDLTRTSHPKSPLSHTLSPHRESPAPPSSKTHTTFATMGTDAAERIKAGGREGGMSRLQGTGEGTFFS